LERNVKAVVHRPHVFWLREEGEGKPRRPRTGVRLDGQDRPSGYPHRVGGGSARREESGFAADVLPGLRAGRDGYGRLHMARGAVDAEGDRLRRIGANAVATYRRRSTEHFESRNDHGREAQAEAVV